MKTWHFRPIGLSYFISNTVKDTAIKWKTNNNSYARYRILPSPMSNDLELPINQISRSRANILNGKRLISLHDRQSGRLIFIGLRRYTGSTNRCNCRPNFEWPRMTLSAGLALVNNQCTYGTTAIRGASGSDRSTAPKQNNNSNINYFINYTVHCHFSVERLLS